MKKKDLITIEVDGKVAKFRKCDVDTYSAYTSLASDNAMDATFLLFDSCYESGDRAVFEEPMNLLSIFKHREELIPRKDIKVEEKEGGWFVTCDGKQAELRKPTISELGQYLSKVSNPYQAAWFLCDKCFVSGDKDLFNDDYVISFIQVVDDIITVRASSVKK